ncbi:HutD/Ves family protein [Nakamurella leprariae]|uniref:HutD family protein n=1 Tax=Nakamurella leprariae TaxID=2803911 RepID=A0A939BZ97_9ACTN|nr:HutD family protein [Nakamurella leprariae]MBM9467471.1 HutD family protein [Nakamurella leprariae]
MHTIRRIADTRPEPWRNGGGTTRRLLPVGGGADVGLRLSVAELLRDGPFSSFPDIDRVFTVVGPPVELTIDSRAFVVPEATPIRFSGAAAAAVRLLDGPTRAINVMTDPTRYRADVRTVRVHGPVPPCSALVVLSGSVLVGDATIGPLDAILAPSPATAGDAHILDIKLDAVAECLA